MNSTTNKKDQGNSNPERAKDSGDSIGGRIKDVASNVGQAVGKAASTVGQKIDDAAGSVGSGMHSLGETVRDKGPEKGVLGTVTGKVADALEGTGDYLEKKKLSGMAEDVTNLIRNNPIPALLIGIGVGFLLSRMMRG